MLDVVYIAITLGFFALMLAYVRGCDRLGRAPDTAPAPAGDGRQDGRAEARP